MGAGPADPWVELSGTRVLTEAEYQQVDAAMQTLVVTTNTMCGYDGVPMAVWVTAPHGTTMYSDSAYVCDGGDEIYVDNIDHVLYVLGQLATP
jgi:hypothetical protein